jgi:thymidylate synthase
VKPKPKKVWTNDDMSEVTGTISVVGTPQQQKPTNTPSKIPSFQPAVPSAGNPKQASATKSSDDTVDPKVLAQLRQQLQKLQANIDQVDKQIEQLKGASRGDSKNLGILTSDPSSYSMEPVPEQIKTLEAKKSALQGAMDQLLDAARASGIEPGQLR